MDNKAVIQKLKQEAKGKTHAQQEEVIQKFLVFRLGPKKFALPAEEVREISLGDSIFFVPFVPPYIRGFINRHGEPYTVIDIQVLFENEQLKASTFLILNTEEDQACFLISDVQEILKLSSEYVHTITSVDESNRFFLKTIQYNDEEIFVLNTTSILERLENDVRSE
ncbi:MAG: chemotaxis protein CheW [Spirochaetia bacterium]